MMRHWHEEHAEPTQRAAGTLASVAVHIALITLAVAVTNPPEGFVQGLYTLANKVIYVAPPARVPATEGSKQQLKYEDAAPVGDGAGFPRGPVGAEIEKKPVLLSPQPGDL